MNLYEEFYDEILGHIRRFAFPEEWIAIDIAMSKQELFTMLTVDKLKETTMGQLADDMNFPMSTATGIIDRLVRKGYIERGRSDSDRRIVVISLTDQGTAFVENIKTMILSYIKKAYEALDEEERKTILRIADKVSASFLKRDEEAGQSDKENSRVRKITIE